MSIAKVHDGGFVIGAAADVRPQAANLARKLGVPVICPGYRLAPDALFPAGFDDCHAAWQWLLDHNGEMAIDPAKIVIGGYSAWAGLAACHLDVSGLSPSWLGIGTCDLFLDEGRAYAQRLTGAGVATEYAELKGANHGFDLAGTQMSQEFTQLQRDFVQKFVS